MFDVRKFNSIGIGMDLRASQLRFSIANKHSEFRIVRNEQKASQYSDSYGGYSDECAERER